jgi:hypothetical protein
MTEPEEKTWHHSAATAEWVYVNGQLDIQQTLCGREAIALWCSLPIRFMLPIMGFQVEYSEPVPPQCPDCLAHPDLPLLLLGQI